jgi:hypothetical protein
MATWKRVAFSWNAGSARITDFRQIHALHPMREYKQETLFFDRALRFLKIGNVLFV